MVGRYSHDYYGHSVALGLAPRGRSRVRPRRTSERDVGAPLISFNALTGHRSTPRRLNWPFYNASAGCDVGVRCHADGRFFTSSGDWGSSSPAFAISHGSRRRLSPAPGPDRRFAGMRLSRSPHGSGLAIGPRNLPSSSSRLRRGYDNAPRAALALVHRHSAVGFVEAELRRAGLGGSLVAHEDLLDLLGDHDDHDSGSRGVVDVFADVIDLAVIPARAIWRVQMQYRDAIGFCERTHRL